MQSKIDVIDLFAGPGGLGEGFSNCKKNSPFEIRMSVEFEKHAHKTLTLRAFYRKLNSKEKVEYFDYIESVTEREKTLNFEKMIKKHPKKWEQAQSETLFEPHALGNPGKWEKIKKGLPIEKEDELETENEKSIFEKIREIKKNNRKPIIVIGGPPCQAYSVNGRNRIQAETGYTPENDERFFLYQEYLKVLDAAQPDLFIMENVEGITSAKLASGERIFERIKRELQRPQNKPDERYDLYSLVTSPISWNENGPQYSKDSDFSIKASDFGVPQQRKRIIILGILRKYGRINSIMRPISKDSPPTIKELIGNLPPIRSGISNRLGCSTPNTYEAWLNNWKLNVTELKSILTNQQEIEYVTKRQIEIESKKRTRNGESSLSTKERKELYIKHQKLIENSFKATYEELTKLGTSHFPNNISDDIGNHYCIQNSKYKPFSIEFSNSYKALQNWIQSPQNLVLNHGTRLHMKTDLLRYLFCALWAAAHKQEKSPSPNSKYFPKALAPKHGNWKTGNHADRFRVIESGQVPLTITSHLRKDGHAQIHYDPIQNRSLTVREAARIQTFPDDYFFEGKQGWQFQQVGNAVPSFLAKQIALFVLDVIKNNIRSD